VDFKIPDSPAELLSQVDQRSTDARLDAEEIVAFFNTLKKGGFSTKQSWKLTKDRTSTKWKAIWGWNDDDDSDLDGI